MSSPKSPSKQSPKSPSKSKSEKTVKKSPNDQLDYKFIKLDNGLRALLVSDPSYKTLTDSDAPPKTRGRKSRSKHRDQAIVSRSPTPSPGPRTPSPGGGTSSGGESDKSGRGGKRTRRSLSRPRKRLSNEKLSAVVVIVRTGSFSDPRKVQGLAHLCEHCVTMGSKKFPAENELDQYLTSRGGYQNAHTEYEYTSFEVEIQRKHMLGALERLAQCFTDPLLKAESVVSEVKPVNTEFTSAKADDEVRFEQILANLADSDHPLNTFAWGNSKSLIDIPKKDGTDTHKHVREFVAKHYTADNIHLVIQSQESMETLDKWIRDLFGGLKKQQTDKSDGKGRKDKLDKEKDKSGKDNDKSDSNKKFGLPFDKNKNLNKYYLIRPVGETDQFSILWCMPPVIEHFKTSPLDYWGHLIGHEGPGSLVSLLRKENLALELSAGVDEDGFHSNTYSSFFAISIRLTDAGSKALDKVVAYVFEYIAMLKKSGPKESFFKELQQIEDNRFHWEEESKSIDHVNKLSVDMVYCPPDSWTQYALRGSKLYIDFKKELLQSFIDLMTPEKACFVRQATDLVRSQDKSAKIEKWFETKYIAKDVPKDWLKKANPDSNRFHLPKENNFIAKKFNIKKPENITPYPTKVLNENRVKLWYKPDDKFKHPKAIIKLHLVSEHIWHSAENAVANDLFLQILMQLLSEDTYAATLAGLYLSVLSSVIGLTICVSGFDEKLSLLLDTVFERIMNFKFTDKQFADVKKELAENYNNDNIDPTTLNKELRLSLISKKYYNSIDKRAAMKRVDRDYLKKFCDKFSTEFYIEGLIQGNYTLKESVDLMHSIAGKCKITAQMSAIEEPKLQCRKLPVGKTHMRVLALSNDQNNSCVTNYIQIGPADIRLHMLVATLTAVTEEPCFNQLRTKEHLGYSVWAVDSDAYGISAYSVGVVSMADDFDCTHIDNRIEDFISKYVIEKVFKELTEEKFKEHITAMVTNKSAPDLQLSEEFTRNWTEIMSFNYCFDRIEKEIKALQAIKFNEFKQWAEEQVLKNDNKKRILCMEVVGYGKKAIEECLTTDGKKVPFNPDKSESHGKKLKLTYLRPKTAKNGQTYLEAIEKFREKLEMYPNNKVSV